MLNFSRSFLFHSHSSIIDNPGPLLSSPLLFFPLLFITRCVQNLILVTSQPEGRGPIQDHEYGINFLLLHHHHHILLLGAVAGQGREPTLSFSSM
ncbi:hypothetical protein Mapa_011637 [Marchantia paleacea]|nr:hypothetical protein Mapa_011637 [Marchantia paleacea]